MKTSKTDVIIIGAGPTGLSLACQLLRFGIDFVVVEQNEGVTQYSKAIGVQARTLEIYEQLGLSRRAIEDGEIANKVRLLAGGQVRGELQLGNYGKSISPYPYMLMLEQSKNEKLLYELLQSHGKDVLWKTELEGFSQDEAGVSARVKGADGTQTINARYLVGCDGASSKVRRDLGLSFAGSTFERLFFVADVQIDWELPHDAIQVCLGRNVFTAFFPMKGDKRYRIVGTFPEGADQEDREVLYDEIEEQIRREAQLPLEISDVKWFSLYKVHSRRVNQFSVRRCFVAGDAAHIHTPVGAQGMNTGIQDAYNLGWKLAYVIKGYAGRRLLETYNDERLPNAKRLLETTDRLFELGAGSNWLLSLIRTTIFPPLAGFVASLDSVRKRMFPLISQTGISYRNSSLSDHTSAGSFKVKAGDRMPYLTLEGKSIYENLRAPGFHLLRFSSDMSETDLTSPVEVEYRDMLDYQIFGLNPIVRELFGMDKTFHVLLRPDNHIAFISPGASLSGAMAYLDKLREGSAKEKFPLNEPGFSTELDKRLDSNSSGAESYQPLQFASRFIRHSGDSSRVSRNQN